MLCVVQSSLRTFAIRFRNHFWSNYSPFFGRFLAVRLDFQGTQKNPTKNTKSGSKNGRETAAFPAHLERCPRRLCLQLNAAHRRRTASKISLRAGLPAVSWPWVRACGSLEPSRRAGENAQKTGKNGEKMGEIRSKNCRLRALTRVGRVRLFWLSSSIRRRWENSPRQGNAFRAPAAAAAAAHCTATATLSSAAPAVGRRRQRGSPAPPRSLCAGRGKQSQKPAGRRQR
eukprot:COSAG04_NODE_1284_length_7376_cov_4.157345_3_plen_229_part_00